MREVRQVEPYLFKIGSKEAGQKWSEIASALNSHADFSSNPREQRSVRERFNKIFAEFKTKMRNEEKASGVTPDELTETEQLLEEIKEIITSNSGNTPKSTDKAKGSDREKALAMRKKSMESWGKSQRKSESKEDDDDEEEEEEDQVVRRRKRHRRSRADPLEYLQMKRKSETEFKKEEMALLKEKLALEDKKLQIEQAKQAQMQEQLLLQQKQMQQPMQAQTQSQALILAFLQKMNK